MTSERKDSDEARAEVERLRALRFRDVELLEAAVERLQRTVNLLQAGARDIAYGDYANSPARSFALRMLSDTEKETPDA